MRRAFAAAGVLAVMGTSGAIGWAPAAGATLFSDSGVSGPCTATLAGMSVANHDGRRPYA